MPSELTKILLIGGAALLLVACKEAPRPSVEASKALTSAAVAPRSAPAVIGSSSGSALSAEISAIPTSRVHCLRAPYFPEPAATPVIGGFQVSHCAAEEGTAVLRNTMPGKDTADLQSVAAHLDKLVGRDPPGRVPVTVGPCCAKPGSRGERDCVRLDVTLCTMTMEQVATLFARALSELSVEGKNIGLRVQLHGMTGPRCSATDPSCASIARFSGPENVRTGDFALPYNPTAARTVSARASAAGGACQYDGECVQEGGCVAWYRTGVPVGGSHVKFLWWNDEYCGCVGGQCRAFTSARRSVVLDAALYTTEQGRHKPVDALQVLYGFGRPKHASKGLQDRLHRQLTRCYLGHEAELPQTFDITFTVPAKGGDARLGLANPKSPAERCASEALSWQYLPAPPSAKRMAVTGQLSLRLAEAR